MAMGKGPFVHWLYGVISPASYKNPTCAKKKNLVGMEDFTQTRDGVAGGLKGKSKIISPKEKGRSLLHTHPPAAP